ncbi:MAG: (Fe-S)-binding protein [Candidatus Thermoplasmatota archaeon]
MANQCPAYPDEPCRVNLDLMPHDTALWMYFLTAVAVGIFLYGFYEMVKVWRLGKAWKPGDWKIGLRRLAVGLATHRKFMQDRAPGSMHAWIFSGFVVLFIGTAIVAIDADFFEHLLKEKLLFGKPYLAYEFILDAFGVVFLVGVGYAMWRRYGDRPPHLHVTRLPERPRWLPFGGDFYALAFLFGIGVTGFLMEGIRLQHQIQTDGITYASWSFVGNVVGLAFAGLAPDQMLAIYPVLWWTHFTLWSSVLAVLPWTKFKHIATSSLNLYFHDPKRQSRPELPTPFNLQKVMESGTTDIPPVGYATIRDLTWKDRLSLDACTNCGRCEAQCPATAAGRPLSPRKLIQDLKAEMWRDYRDGGKPESPQLASVDGVGSALKEATLWSCTSCRACVTACPVDIEHVDLIMEMRRGLVMQSRLDEHQQKLLVNITNAGNPYGFPASDRPNWTAQLPPGVIVPTMADLKAAGKQPEYLWWVGCSGSFDPRNQKVTTSIATILNAAGVDFAILGAEERCNGDPARRLGEEGRFQQSALENIAVMQSYGITKVIAQCPHCFNTLRNEYPEFGAKLDVVHHTQLIERLIADDKLPLKDGKAVAITYHDSCYLMRHNGVADAPRNVLRRANNGLPVLEMAQNREQGLCCGAGGANMWYEVKDEKERINVIRAKQAADTGADTVATACPFCLTMMSDGLSLTGQEGKMQARDLAEIVADHLDWTPPAPPTPVAAEVAAGGGGGGWSG